MPNEFNILLGMQLDTSSKSVEEINAQINQLSEKVSKLNIKVTFDSDILKNITQEFKELQKNIDLKFDFVDPKNSVKLMSSELDKIQYYYKILDNGAKELYRTVKDITDEYGRQKRIIEEIDKLGNVDVKEIDTNNYKKQREDQEKLLNQWLKAKDKRIDGIHKEALAVNKLYDAEQARVQKIKEEAEKQQSALISKQVKEKMEEMTRTPDGVKQLNDYYRELEKTLGTVKQTQDQVNISQQKYWDSVRQEKMTDMTTKSQELKDMAKYYTILEKESWKLDKANRGLIGNFDKLKNTELQAKDVANLLSQQYGGLEVRGYSLDKQTGQYTVTLKNNAKENLVLKGAIEQVSGALRVQSETVQEAKNRNLGFFEQLKIALERVPIWLSATTIYFQGFNFLRQMVTDISSINAAMIDLAKVSDATEQELSKFQEISPSMASDLGVLNSELQSVTNEIVRLGYSLEEAKQLSDVALIMKNIGDLDNVGQAMDYMVSIMKAFNVEVDGTTKIMDFLNYTADTTSVSFQDLGEGITRIASSMSEANNTLEETMGMLVASTDLTRSAEKSSTALRTIAMRLRGVDEAGENMEGFIPKLEGQFNDLGLTLRKNDNTFKSTYEIIKDLSEIWNNPEFSDMQKAQILESIAGKRQADVASGLINNFKEAEKVVNNATNAVGSASKEQERYMNSVEAAQKRLMNSLTELNQKLLESGTIIGALNFADGFVQNAAATGKWNVVMLIAVGALGLLATAQRKTIINSVQLEAVTLASGNGFKKLTADIGTATLALLGIKPVADGAKISILALNVALGGILLGLPILIQLIGAFIRNNKEANAANYELIESYGQVTKKQNDNINTLNSLKDEYNNLNNKLGENRDFTQLTADEQKRYNEIAKQLDQIAPDFISAYDAKGNALVVYKKKIEDLIEVEKEQLELERQRLIASGSTIVRDSKNEISSLEQEKNRKQREIESLQNALLQDQSIIGRGFYQEGTNQYDMISDRIKKTKNDIVEMQAELVILNNKISESTEKQRAVVSARLADIDAITGVSEALKQSTKDFVMAEFTAKGYDDAVGQIDSLKNILIDVEKLYNTTGANAAESLQKSIIKTLKTDLGMSTEKAINFLQNYIDILNNAKIAQDEAGNSTDSLAISSQQLAEKQNSILENFKLSTDKLRDYAKYLAEINSEEGLSGKSQFELIKTYPQLLSYLGNEVELKKKIIEMKIEEEKVQKDLYINMMNYDESFYSDKIKTNKELLIKMVGFYNEDFENYKSLAELKLKTEMMLLNGLSQEWKDFYNKLKENPQDQGMRDSLLHGLMVGNKDAIQVSQALQKMQESEEEINKLILKISGINFNTLNDQDAKKADKKNPIDKIFNKLPVYNAQIKDVTSSLEKINKELSKMENDISVAQAKFGLSSIGDKDALETSGQILKLQTSLLAKRKEERNVLSQTADKLRDIQSQIGKEFKTKFKLDISTITEKQIKDFADNIDKQTIDLQNKLNRATDDVSRNSIQKQIDNLTNGKTIFNELIQAFRSGKNEIEELGSEWWRSFFDSVDLESEIKQRIADLQEELKQLNFEKFELSVQRSMNAITPFNNQIDLLNDKLNMLSSTDYDGKMQTIASQMETAKSKGELLRLEFDRLSSIIPTTSELAEYLTGELSNLHGQIQENTMGIVNYQKEIDNLRLEKLISEFDNVNEQLGRELKMIDNNLAMLQDGLIGNFDINLGFDFSLPQIPQSLYEKTRQESEKIVKDAQDRAKKIQEIQEVSQNIQEKKNKDHYDNIKKELTLHYASVSKEITDALKLQQSEYENGQVAITQVIDNMLNDIELNHKFTFETIITDIRKFVSDALVEYEKLHGFVPVVLENKSIKPTKTQSQTTKQTNNISTNVSRNIVKKESDILNDAFTITIEKLIDEVANELVNNLPTIENVEVIVPETNSDSDAGNQVVSDINYNVKMSDEVTNAFDNYMLERTKTMKEIETDQALIIEGITKGIDVSGLKEEVLRKIDEQTKKDVEMQYLMKEDLLRQQNAKSLEVINNFKDQYNNALKNGDVELAEKLRDQYEKAYDIYVESNEKIIQVTKDRYNYEFSLIDRNLAKQQDGSKIIQQNLKQLELMNKNDYDGRIKLTNDLISSEQQYANSLSAEIASLEKLRDTKPIGSIDWNIINQKVDAYKQMLIDSNYNIEQMRQNVAGINFDSLMSGTSAFDKEISDLEYALNLKQALHKNDIENVNDMQEIYDLNFKIADATQRQVDYLYEVLGELKDQQSVLEQNSTQWLVIEGQIDNIIAKIRTANLAIAQQTRDAFSGMMDQYIPPAPQPSSFDMGQPSNINDSDDYINGLEKQLMVQKLLNYAEEHQLTLSEEQLELLNSQGAVRRENLEMLQKELELQQLQKKLENLKNQKTIQTLKQQEDGTWQFEYVVDQEAIDEVEDQILDKQLEIEQAKNNAEKEKARDAQQAWQDMYAETERLAQEHYDEQLKLLNDILDKAENRYYKSADEFKKALESVGLNLPIDEMVDEYWKYYLATAELYGTEAINIIKAILTSKSKEFQEAGNENAKSYVDGLSQKIDEILSGNGDIQTKQKAIIDMLANESANFALAGNQSGMEFINGLLNSISTDDVNFDFNSLSSIIISKLNEQAENLKNNGQNVGSQIIQGLLNGIDIVMNDGTIENKTQAIIDLLNMSSQYKTLGESLGNNFVDGLISVVANSSNEVEDKGSTTLQTAINEMIKQLDEKIVSFAESGDGQGVAYAEALKVQLTDLLDSTDTTQEDILDVLNKSKEFNLIGSQNGDSYKKSIVDQLSSTKSKSINEINNVIGAMMSKSSDFSYLGELHGKQYADSILFAFEPLTEIMRNILEKLVGSLSQDVSYSVDMSASISALTQTTKSNTRGITIDHLNPDEYKDDSKSKTNTRSSLSSTVDMIDLQRINSRINYNNFKNILDNVKSFDINSILVSSLKEISPIKNNQSQQIYIDNVNFPNATTSNEIEKAIKNLPSVAYQYASKK
jgi:TP901 family phage tail tape measure protein